MSEAKQYPITTAGTTRPGFRIGRFTLYDSYSGEPGLLAIATGGGEEGDFTAEALEAVIAKFYEENF